MAGSRIFRFEQAVAWLEGRDLAGDIKEIELPELSWDASEHETISLPGTPEFASKLEALECTITWASYSPDLAAASSNPYKAVNLQIRANIGEYNASGKAGDKLWKIDLSGRFMSGNLGTISPGEMERESMLKVDRIREVYDGTELMELSINPPIYRVNGVDLFADVRKNLGLN